MSGEAWRRTQDVLLGRLLVQGGRLARPAVTAALDEAARRAQSGTPTTLAGVLIERGDLDATAAEGVLREVHARFVICPACGGATERPEGGAPPSTCSQCNRPYGGGMPDTLHEGNAGDGGGGGPGVTPPGQYMESPAHGVPVTATPPQAMMPGGPMSSGGYGPASSGGYGPASGGGYGPASGGYGPASSGGYMPPPVAYSGHLPAATAYPPPHPHMPPGPPPTPHGAVAPGITPGAGRPHPPNTSRVLPSVTSSGKIPTLPKASLSAKLPGGESSAEAGVPFEKYRLLGELGRGGMGIVYKAWHPTLRRLYALKVLLAGEDASPEMITRFMNEAAAVARMGRHPHIVEVHETGQVGNRYYFTLDFVDGPALDVLVKEKKGNVPVRQAVDMMRKVALAVHHAHKAGIIHRDLKPQNILIDSRGEPHVTDFGLAKDVGGETGLTKTGVAMGSPPYMSPEQASGKHDEVGPRSDVYSLGSTLYHALTGRPPFEGSSMLNIITKVLGEDAAPMRGRRPSIPREVDAIVLRALRKEQDKRYESAKAFADDLERWLRGREVQARPPGVGERMARFMKRNRGVVIAIVVGGVLTAGAVGFAVKNHLANAAIIAAENERRERIGRASARLEAARKLPMLEAQIDERIALLDDALEIVPGYPPALRERAETMLRADRVDDAIGDLVTLIEAHPDDVEARYRLGELLATRKGDLEGAREQAGYIRNVKRRSPLGALLDALVKLESNATQAARDALAVASVNGGQDMWQYFMLEGRLSLLPGPAHDPEDAKASFTSALQRRNGVALLHGLRALAREELGEETGVRADCEAALEADPDCAVALAVRAPLLAADGREKEALEDLERAESLEPRSVEPLYHRGLVYLATKAPEAALQELEAAMTKSPEDARILAARGRAFADLGQFAEAVASLERAQELAPGNETYPRWLQQVKRRRDEASKPPTPPKPPVDPPVDVAGQLRQATALINTRQRANVQRAVAILSGVLQASPNDLNAIMIRAQAHHLLRQFDLERADLERAIRLAPRDPRVHCARTRALIRMHDYRGAMGAIEQLERLDPAHDDLLRMRGQAKDGLGDVNGAFADIQAFLKRYPNDFEGWWVLSRICGKRKDVEGRRKALGEAIRINPNYHQAHEDRGTIYFEAGKLDEAIVDLVAAVKTSSNCTHSRLILARAFIRKGRREDCLEVLDELARMDPRNRANIAKDEAFAPLRDDPEFKRIVGGG